MPNTQLLTDQQIAEIAFAQAERLKSAEAFGVPVPAFWHDIDALIATVKQLRIRIQLLESQWCECGHLKTAHGFFSDHDECYECDQASPDLCCEWRPVTRPNTELEQLRAENQQLKLIVDIGTNDDPGTALSKLHKIQHVAATSMRDKCVEKLGSLVEGYKNDLFATDDEDYKASLGFAVDALDKAIRSISPLTLEPLEPEKQKL